MFAKKNNDKPETDKERAERIAKVTMTGDLRDCLLDFMKHDKNPLPWNLQGEDDQAATIEKVEKAVQYAVERCVQLIAAENRSVITAKLDQVVIKDGIKATLILSKMAPERHQLCDSQGANVLILISDTMPFEGERAPAEITPLQSVLPGTDDEGDEETDAA